MVQAVKDGYEIKTSKSTYNPSTSGTCVVVTKMKNYVTKQCSNCSNDMVNFKYFYAGVSGNYNEICFTCCETLKYMARIAGYLIGIKYHYGYKNDEKKTETKTYPREYTTSAMTTCSKCFSYTFRYKAWSYKGLTGLCESCANNM
jgi:hypothetical protein